MDDLIEFPEEVPVERRAVSPAAMEEDVIPSVSRGTRVGGATLDVHGAPPELQVPRLTLGMTDAMTERRAFVLEILWSGLRANRSIEVALRGGPALPGSTYNVR